MLSLHLLIAALLPVATALTCYENDDEGNIYERTNSSWTYCSLIPFASPSHGGKLQGVGPAEEKTDGYDATFSQSGIAYKILTVCIYEKYDFGTIAPAFSKQKPEFMFRCFCNYDRCNSATTFVAYLSGVRAANL